MLELIPRDLLKEIVLLLPMRSVITLTFCSKRLFKLREDFQNDFNTCKLHRKIIKAKFLQGKEWKQYLESYDGRSSSDIVAFLEEKRTVDWIPCVEVVSLEGNLELVKLFCEKHEIIRQTHKQKFDFRAKDMDQEGIRSAIQGNQFHIVEFFLERTPNFMPTVNDALVHAVKSQNTEMVKYLVERGATEYYRPLSEAVSWRYKEGVEIFVTLGERVRWIYFEKAVRRDWVEIVEVLITHGRKSFSWDTAVCCALTSFSRSSNVLRTYCNETQKHEFEVWEQAWPHEKQEFRLPMGVILAAMKKGGIRPDDLISEALQHFHPQIIPFCLEKGAKLNFNRVTAEYKKVAEFMIQQKLATWDGILRLALEAGKTKMMKIAIHNGADWRLVLQHSDAKAKWKGYLQKTGYSFEQARAQQL